MNKLAIALLPFLLGPQVFSCRDQSTLTAAQESNEKREEVKRGDFYSRMSDSIQRNSELDVVYRDHLGEGRGHWDADPRYPTDDVNCMTWLQLVLSEAYSTSEDDRQTIMDAIRYYGGHVGFGFRKHFIDRWTKLNPGPLKKIESKECMNSNSVVVDLQLNSFKRNIGYTCPLYREDMRKFTIRYMSGSNFVSCASSLNPGFYVVFGIASKKYQKIYGGFSGPMAQVHGMILEVPEHHIGDAETETSIHHASTSRGMVMTEDLSNYIESMSELFSGYTLYDLDPDWIWTKRFSLDSYELKVTDCEKRMKGTSRKIFENEQLEGKGAH